MLLSIGQSSASVYYDDTLPGTPSVSAADSSFTAAAASQMETINVGPEEQVAISSPAFNLPAGTRGQLTLTLEDAYGNAVVNSLFPTQTIDLSTTSPGGAFYASQTSTTSVSSVSIGEGQSTVSVYYADTQAGARP